MNDLGRLLDRRTVGAMVILLLCCLTSPAQVAVSVGAGSYASFVPSFDQQADEYYAVGAQQIVDLYPSLHLAPSAMGKPLPSNKWWTDTLMGIRGWSYNSTNIPPSVVTQDSYGGQLWAFPAMLAPNSSGFNLYFPNAWSTGTPPAGGFNAGPALNVVGSIPLAVGANDILIADFDQTNYPAGWTVTGNAFGTGPIPGGSWSGQSPPVTGFLGGACINTYRGGDSFQGTLTSPPFTIQKNFIQLLTGGGNDLANDAVWLVISNQVVFRAAGNDSGVLAWSTWNVSAYAGQTAQIEIVDTTAGGWGHVMCSWIVATDNGSAPAARYTGTYTATQSVVTGWSDWGFQFSLPDASGRHMDLTMARGVPFVWTTCTGVNPAIAIGITVIYDTNGTAISLAATNSFNLSAFAFDFQGRSFGVFAPDNTTFTVAGTTVTAQLSGTNNYLVYGLLPAHTSLNEFAQYAYAQVTNTLMNWAYDRTNGQIDTTWTLTANPLKNGETNTLQGWLPHHYRTTQNNLAFKPYSYLTPRGLMKVTAGNQFQINYAFHGIAPMLPAPQTNGLPNDYVQSWMQTYVQNFANAGHPSGDETYGAGKDFGVAAQYLTFANQMGLTTAGTQLKTAIESRLQDWYTYTPGEAHHFFASYTNWSALVGFDASYGSQGFNDNHFHYGYFMVGTALVGLSDPNWLSQYGPMAKLVAKEYANWDRTDTNFPVFRTFDIWEGHSWAGGTSSGGGENQESSSEAMNSWVGIFLMGNALGDDAMTAAGAMGYSMESAAVNEYWQDIYQTNFPATYGKSMNGILGAGSLAFATYFDGDPSWVYSIQMVPQNHWNNYLVRNKAYAFLQFSNLWNDRLVWQPAWSSSVAYTAGNWVKYNGYIWSANSNVAAGQPAPSFSNSAWSEQANISTSTANDLGAYPGNYVLAWEAMFNPDDVAALFAASYVTNGAITGDGTYSGITYYLTHALRGLGDPDTNFYTGIPTSQVYYNARTGSRTILVYNPAAAAQTVTVYSNGTPVSQLSAAPGTLTVHAGPVPGTFEPALTRNLQLTWPTTAGDNYKVQWTAAPSGAGSTWNNLTGLLAGDGTTNSLFDPLGTAGTRAYRVLEYATYVSTNVANGGFETGAGANAANWTSSGIEPPYRVNTNSHAGTWSMLLADTNKATGGIQFQQDEQLQGAAGVTPGLTYTFSFWAQQILSGVGYVQQYSLSWLNSANSVISTTGASFNGGGGYWSQIVVLGLVAPAGAVGARINFNCTTGAANGWSGEVLIDDVLLSTSAPGTTNVVSAAVQPGWQVSWPTASHVTYGLQSSTALNSANAWTDYGVTFTGTGGRVSAFVADGADRFKFYRVYAQP
ncbi:MAG TPA: glycosyl hydrolase [Verrucomicrobiae bacterium]|nr:glycosyl hydrolase [Verrucomicrobiae bacterium]